MSWTDVDNDPRTFNSSRAPDKVAIAYAKLGWAGSATCRHSAEPPGKPQDPVTLNGTSMSPDRFVIDTDPSHTDTTF
jgi:hypothetical protein